MKCRTASQRNAAFSFLELFLVLVVVTVLVALILPLFARARANTSRRPCTNHLRQLALAFHLWAQDYKTGFPMEVPASKGGTREAALAGQLLPNLLIMSNQLRSSSILICPADKRKVAADFTKLASVNVSYFLNVDAALTNQNHILAGDRNLAVAGSPVRPGLLQTTNSNDLAWTKGTHDHGGNVALVDGSAHKVTTQDLRDIVTASGPTNRLIIP